MITVWHSTVALFGSCLAVRERERERVRERVVYITSFTILIVGSIVNSVQLYK